jgi:purine-binding chemotaxis protein CheW
MSSTSSHGSVEQSGGASANLRTGQVCVFSLGKERHALSTSLLQEVVRDIVIEEIPMTPPEVVGVFNLRGTPTVLLDTNTLIRSSTDTAMSRANALVLRDDELRVALAVDRVDGVIEMTQKSLLPVPAGGADYCEGFIELPDSPGLVAVISVETLLRRIRALQFTTGSGKSDSEIR